MITKKQITDALFIAATVGEIIRDSGSIPSGHLYSLLMGQMPIDDYNSIIRLLKENELIKEENHLLTWIGD